ncbi:hypothetical protein CRE_26312 [Caenorhabditis remanei]|uniref:Uncharacterized protein n=2 Tax=Caenorhabditis remanei TaxID=31234 RepID=E3LRA6_CAERE|nr:hypothetical protein CRE_26312 [Caenorhabditis remanei]
MISNVRSSLVYQVLLNLQKTLSLVYFLVMFILFFYKGTILPYPRYVRVMEFFIIIPFAPIEYLRISWGSRGNLLESTAFLALSTILSVPIIIILVYLEFFQNYVLFIEEIFTYVVGFFVILQTLLSLVLSITFSSSGQPASGQRTS